MKLFTFKGFMLLLLIGLVSFANGASISGVVTDANTGLPVDSAMVVTVGTDPVSRDSVFYSTTTGADGSYSLDNVIPAVYYLWCRHNDYLPSSQGNVVVSDSASNVTVDFSLTPQGGGSGNFVGGIVYSVTGNSPIGNIPLDGASVHLAGNGLVYSTNSDSGGFYGFSDIPTGLYTLSADAPNHIPQSLIDSLWIDDNTNIRNLDIYLILDDSTTTFSTLSGFVYEIDSTGSTGAPIDSALIQLYPSNPMMSWAYEAYTNPDGSYQIDNIEPEVYYAVCQAPGYLPAREFGIDLTTGNVTLDFYLDSDSSSGGTAVLSGSVWADSVNRPPALPGTPVYPADITVLGYDNMGDSLVYITVNDSDGSYIIDDILPGTYTVICDANGYQREYIHDFVIEGGPNTLDFYLNSTSPSQKGHIYGTVTSDSSGNAVPGAYIEFISMRGMNYSSFTDMNGNYVSPAMPAGDYYVACYIMSGDSNFFYMEYFDDAHTLSNATLLTLVENDSIVGIDFGVPTSSGTAQVTVSGNVSDNSNQPIANAIVTAWSYRNPMTGGDSISTRTDAQGNYSFTIQNTSPQYAFSFFVSAEKRGYEIEFWQEKATPWEADPIWVYGDTSITGINFTLDVTTNNNSISGFITDDASNAPINNAFIIAADASSGQIHFTFTDSVGYYNFSNLDNNYYYLLFTANGYAPEFYDDVYLWEDATPVYASGSVMGIDAGLAGINPGTNSGIISGTVLDDNNLPLTGVLLAIKNDAGDVIGYDMTDNQGTYEVNGIANGNHSVSASKISYNSETENIVFNSNNHNTLIVNFDLDQSLTAVPEPPENMVPTKLELLANYPNPFNPETKISINLPKDNKVRLVIYNVLGQMVSELVNGELSAGTHTFAWNGTDQAGKVVSTGVYFYMLQVDGKQLVKKMIFNK